ncbi:MAG: NAD(P)-dependent oxidoreductase [Actinobacteria bacterium]|nr:NAD(P)-dependent oxidoreductase [Actinomycetota bacterium]
MHVVVTGAAGFIGHHVVAALVGRGDEVTAIDRRGGAGPGRALVDDLAVPSAASIAALATCDAVIHLAGRPGVRDNAPHIERHRIRDNVLAGARVLAATPLATPVVVASSSSVYGGARGTSVPRPSREDDPVAPRGGYAASKVALERLCVERAAKGGRVAVARPFTVAGEGQRPDMAIARWIEAVRRGQPVTVIGSPRRSRDVTDVRDVVRALIEMVDQGVTGTLNIGTGVAHRLGDIVTSIASALGQEPRVRVVAADGEEPPATLADTTRCRRLLGFVPVTDLADIVRRQVESVQPLKEAV